jgi:hypothetical protein
LHAIGRALGKAHPVIHLLLKRHGVIAPFVRHGSRTAITLQEREDAISEGNVWRKSVKCSGNTPPRGLNDDPAQESEHGEHCRGDQQGAETSDHRSARDFGAVAHCFWNGDCGKRYAGKDFSQSSERP